MVRQIGSTPKRPRCSSMNAVTSFGPRRGRVGGRRLAPRGRAGPTGAGLLPPPHRTVRAVLPHTAHRRSSPAALRPSPPDLWPGGDGGSVEIDQPHAAGRGDELSPAVTASALVALSHEQREAFGRVAVDLGELDRGVSVAKVLREAAQEDVDLPDDLLDRTQQPAAVRQFTDPVAGLLHLLACRPAGKERDV